VGEGVEVAVVEEAAAVVGRRVAYGWCKMREEEE